MFHNDQTGTRVRPHRGQFRALAVEPRSDLSNHSPGSGECAQPDRKTDGSGPTRQLQYLPIQIGPPLVCQDWLRSSPKPKFVPNPQRIAKWIQSSA